MNKPRLHGFIQMAVTMAAMFVASCASDSTVPLSPTSRPVVVKTAGIIVTYSDVSDPCWSADPAVFECHLGGVAVDNWRSDPLALPNWDAQNCPDGCTTFPMGPKEHSKMTDELNNHISSDGACQAVKQFLLDAYAAQKIRIFDVAQDPANWGDYHYRSRNLHLATDNFLNQHNLGMTLMHEGFHGYYNNPDDAAAEAFAKSCVTN